MITFLRNSAIALLIAAPLAAAPAVTLFVPRVEFGQLALRGPVAESQTIARISSEAPWQLSAALEPSAATSEKIEVTADGSTWYAVASPLPLPIASGQPTSPEGAPVMLRVRVTPSFKSAPGVRQYAIALFLNGKKMDTPLRVSFDVPPTVTFDEDPSPIAITADRPTERRDYDFSPHRYVVHSNTNWTLQIAPHAGSAGSAAYSIDILDRDGNFQPLTRPMIVASGGPTGDAGVVVNAKLRLHLGSSTPAGKYESTIDVSAKVVGANQ